MLTELTDTQKRGRKIAMTGEEIDAYLATERTCRVATLTSSGAPHVSPLWFVWDGSSLWLWSIVKSQRWADIQQDPRAAVVVDGGVEFFELHGVELRGTFQQVGAAPLTAEETVPELAEPERLFGAKYTGGNFFHDGRHAWLRLTPEKVASWDHRKLGR